MCSIAAVRTLILLTACVGPSQFTLPQSTNAGSSPEPDQRKEGFLDRPRLVEGSTDTRLTKHGVDLDITYTEYGQGIVAGDADHQWQFGGKFFPKLTLDGEKLAGWKGFSLSAIGEITNGDTVDTDIETGLLFPVNTALYGPATGKYGGDLSLTVTQRFGERFSVTIGKFNMYEAASRTPIVGGGGIDGFWNLCFAAPFTGVVPPYLSGGSFGYRTKPMQITVMIYNPHNAQQQTGFKDWGQNGITVRTAVRFPAKLKGRQGFHTITFIGSSKTGTDYNDLPQLILPEHPPLGQKTGSYFGGYTVQQFIWQDPAKPTAGWGVFGQIGFGDSNPNPLAWTMNVGVSGTGVIPKRPLDRLGAGYFYVEPSSQLVNALKTFGLNFGRETGGEFYYTLAIAGWLRVTADLQIIAPGDHDMKTVVLPGVSAQLRF